jgi:hypothetical protein
VANESFALSAVGSDVSQRGGSGDMAALSVAARPVSCSEFCRTSKCDGGSGCKAFLTPEFFSRKNKKTDDPKIKATAVLKDN